MCFVNAFFWISMHACHYVFHRFCHVRMTTFSIMTFQWSLWRWDFFSVEPISAKHLMFESIKFLFWTFGRGARWGAWSIWRWDHTSWAGYVSLSFFVLDLFVFTFEIQRAGYSRLPRFESVHGLNLGLYLSRNFVALASCTSATFMFAFHFAFNAEWMLSLCPMHFPWWAAKFTWLPYLSLSKCLLRHTCLILSHLFCQEPFYSLQKLLLGTAHSKLANWGDMEFNPVSIIPPKASLHNLRMLILVGLPGSGKSSLAARLAAKGYDVVNQDVLGDRSSLLQMAMLWLFVDCIIFNAQYESMMELMQCIVKCVRFHLYTCVKCLHPNRGTGHRIGFCLQGLYRLYVEISGKSCVQAAKDALAESRRLVVDRCNCTRLQRRASRRFRCFRNLCVQTLHYFSDSGNSNDMKYVYNFVILYEWETNMKFLQPK